MKKLDSAYSSISEEGLLALIANHKKEISHHNSMILLLNRELKRRKRLKNTLDTGTNK